MAENNEKTLTEIYKALKKNEKIDTGRFSPSFLLSLFDFGYLKTRPSKTDKVLWEECFECKYPIYPSDITKKAEKKLREFVKRRKDEEKEEKEWREQRAERGFSDEDTWNIYAWFLDIMPKMLQQMRDNLHGFPGGTMFGLDKAVSETAIDDDAEKEPGLIKWEQTLDRMIFLLKEMNEDTCSYENPYEDEYFKMEEAFRKEYGIFGDGLKTEEEKAEEEKTGSHRMYFPTDFPDLFPHAAEIWNNYILHEAYKKHYADNCKEEFFHLFSQNFWDLWD